MNQLFWVVFSVWFCATAVAGSPVLPSYKKSGKELVGTIESVGSDTMGPVMNRWSQEFQKHYPKVEFKIEAKGSGTAAKALVEGRSQLAPMSRLLNGGEAAAFGARYGYPPVGLRVALDAVGVYVHGDNPLPGLTMEQLDGIFSAGQRCGGKRIENWKELVKGWRDEPILAVGRNRQSGTHDFFREHALCNGDFAPNYDDQPDSNQVVYKVSTSPTAIGFSGIGFLAGNVRPVPLALREGEPFVSHADPISTPRAPQTYANVRSGKYPLSRFLYVYVNKAPKRRLSPLVEEFLRFVLSKEGQEIVGQTHFIPINEDTAAPQRAKLEPGYSKPWWESD